MISRSTTSTLSPAVLTATARLFTRHSLGAVPVDLKDAAPVSTLTDPAVRSLLDAAGQTGTEVVNPLGGAFVQGRVSDASCSRPRTALVLLPLIRQIVSRVRLG